MMQRPRTTPRPHPAAVDPRRRTLTRATRALGLLALAGYLWVRAAEPAPAPVVASMQLTSASTTAEAAASTATLTLATASTTASATTTLAATAATTAPLSAAATTSASITADITTGTAATTLATTLAGATATSNTLTTDTATTAAATSATLAMEAPPALDAMPRTWEERLDARLLRWGVPEPYRAEWLKTFLEENSLLPLFHKGGPIMFPLCLASLLSLATVFDRLVFLGLVWLRRDRRAVRRFFIAVAQGKIEDALQLSRSSRHYLMRVLGYALERRDKSLATALIYAQETELKRFRRGIPVLDTVITLAPLLGLLGTVTGMMGSFALIGGELSTPGAITGGIAEALIATAYGLGIAITSLLPFNYLNNKMEEARTEMETAATRLELLLRPRAPRKSAAVRSGHPHAPGGSR